MDEGGGTEGEGGRHGEILRFRGKGEPGTREVFFFLIAGDPKMMELYTCVLIRI